MRMLMLCLLTVLLLGAAAPNGCMRWMNGGPTGDQMPWANGGSGSGSANVQAPNLFGGAINAGQLGTWFANGGWGP